MDTCNLGRSILLSLNSSGGIWFQLWVYTTLVYSTARFLMAKHTDRRIYGSRYSNRVYLVLKQCSMTQKDCCYSGTPVIDGTTPRKGSIEKATQSCIGLLSTVSLCTKWTGENEYTCRYLYIFIFISLCSIQTWDRLKFGFHIGLSLSFIAHSNLQNLWALHSFQRPATG